MPFFQGEQSVPTPDEMCVRDTVGSHPSDARIRLRRNPRGSAQRPTGGMFESPLLRPHPSIAVRDATSAHAERMHHPVSTQRVIVLARRKLRVGSDPIERPLEVAWNLAFDSEMRRVAFHPNRLEAFGQ